MFVLILSLVTTSATAASMSTISGFTSMAACQKAGETYVRQHAPKTLNGQGATYSCVKVG